DWKDRKKEWKGEWKKDGFFAKDSSEHNPFPGEVRRISSHFGDVRVGGPNWHLEDSFIEMKAGSIVVDLRDTVIPDGETTLVVECKAGDIDVILPHDLAVWVEAGVKMGDVRLMSQRNSGGGMLIYKSDNYDEAERKIKMRVQAKFGDVDVKQMG
ncbi:MAG: cell wall-active antibiotics response protein LiaF, partial [Tumebacillaceae bacterium]